MKKNIINFLTVFIILVIGIEILLESESIIKTVKFSFSIWENNIFPALFPFFVIGDLLINLGFPDFLGEILKPIMYKLFKINGIGSFVLILSILSGFPSSAKYTKELYLNGSINEEEASKLLTFTHFSNPLFILGTLSILFLNNEEIGIYILICHYIGNLFVGFIFRNYYVSKKDTNRVSIKRAINKMYLKSQSRKKDIGQLITSSLLNSINTLFLILGTVTLFLILTTVINNNVNISDYNSAFLNGVFELTQGLKYISMLRIPLYNQALIAVFLLSFGGLSVHMQVISIISDTKIKYFPYFIARILHASISSLIFFFWKVF